MRARGFLFALLPLSELIENVFLQQLHNEIRNFGGCAIEQYFEMEQLRRFSAARSVVGGVCNTP